ncbi:MAG: hypothetical protein OXH57_08215, partial [Ekhidna sp.]|nr:hypothetical protein [Ekhidna sp.]
SAVRDMRSRLDGLRMGVVGEVNGGGADLCTPAALNNDFRVLWSDIRFIILVLMHKHKTIILKMQKVF